MKRLLLLLVFLPALVGCPVTQPQQTPVPAVRNKIVATGTGYWLYVPSYYTNQRDWPLVITLHGTYGWDGSHAQIDEWKYLAERHGLIVTAPDLQSVQGMLPVIRSLWMADLKADEKAILALIGDLSAKYRIDGDAILLTGFSAGGYPMYYVGLRNPERFDMLIGRACNCDIEMMSGIELTEADRKLPIMIFWGKDDLMQIQEQSWAAFRYLRERRCFAAERKEVKGGHLRRPELAYKTWRERLAPRHRR